MICARNWIALPLLMLIASPLAAGDIWPEWRGVDGQGHADAVDVPIEWSEKEHVAWKLPIPGLGWSTPVIENGQVWLTTGVDKLAPKDVAAKRRKTSTNSQPLRISSFVSLRAVGVDLDSGEQFRDVEVLNQNDPQMIHIDNSYATPSPIIEDGRLYCHYGPCGFACLDVASNKVLWENRDLVVKHENGPGSSPILWENLLIVHCDGIDLQYIIALDKNTGKEVWKKERTGALNDNPQLRKSYATSLVVDIDGVPVLVSPAADWLYGYDPSSGQELWKVNYGHLGFSNSARPVIADDMVFITTGYMKSEMLALKFGPSRDAKPIVKWSYQKQVPAVSCPIVVGDEIYFASDKGIASCLNAKTGESYWTERIGKKFWAAPLYAEGRLYFFDSSGVTTVIAADKEFKKLAVNKLDGEMLAGAAAVDGALILRTDKALYCIRE